MKRIEITTIVHEIIVTIEGVKYKNQTITMEVYCDLKTGPGQAVCDDPYFIMGLGFWDKEFGAKQSKAIRNICKRAIKSFLKENNL